MNYTNSFTRHSIFVTGLIVFILLSQMSCLSSSPALNERRNKAETDLDVICKNIPVPDNFLKVSSDKTLDIGKVAIFRRFKSKDSCEVVREHFFTYFINQGWNREQMQVKQSRGGMETVDFIFRNNEYGVWVECQNDIDADAEKQIIVSCSWGLG